MILQSPLIDCPPQVAVEAFNRGYAGYPVSMTLTLSEMDRRFRAESLDPAASHVWFSGGRPVAILLVARRGWRARVAGLGVAPEARGTGLGRAAIRLAVAEARARRDRSLELEVIADNALAVALYRKAGFAEAGRLFGFVLPQTTPGAVPLTEIDPAEGARLAGLHAGPDLPWQQQVPTLASQTRPLRCLADEDGRIVATISPQGSAARLVGLSLAPHLQQGAARVFSERLMASLPDDAAPGDDATGPTLTAPALFPQDHRDRFFLPGGWRQAKVEQMRMHHPLLDAQAA